MIAAWSLTGNRLALGLDPIDAVLGTRLARPIHIDVERPGLSARPLTSDSEGFARLAGRSQAPMSRHESGRHAMVMRDDQGASLQVRVYDRHRAWVPRRLEIPLPPASELATSPRIRRPVLFPGVAWDLIGGATGLRSRVRRAGVALRWAWIEARQVVGGELALRTRADDRGEFLLVPGPGTIEQAELDGQFEFDVEAFGPSTLAEPEPGDPDYGDPLWGLPLEVLTLDSIGEARSAGAGPLPSGWSSLGSARMRLTLGRMVSDQTSLEF